MKRKRIKHRKTPRRRIKVKKKIKLKRKKIKHRRTKRKRIPTKKRLK